MSFPPLPEEIPLFDNGPAPGQPGFNPQPDPPVAAPPERPIIFPPPHFKFIRTGAHLISYRPSGQSLVAYDGTFRVEQVPSGTALRASGDLYQRPVIWLPGPTPTSPRIPILGLPPNPAAGIPILPIGQYRYYIRVTSIPPSLIIGTSFTLGFEMWRYNSANPTPWSLEGKYTAVMKWTTPAPTGYPTTGDYLTGDVKNAAGTITGRLTMGWLSKFFRKITVEIDTVSGSPRPLNNGAGVTWQTVFNNIGYDVNVILSQTNIPEPPVSPGYPASWWNSAEMHAAMLKHRNVGVDLNKQWYYYIIIVKRLEETDRGIMFDAYGSDSNKVPREGLGMCSDWVFPNSGWGLCNGKVFSSQLGPYFRTAVHELGHALGLYHHPASLRTHNGYMNTTDVIAGNAVPPQQFPNNIAWAFAPDYVTYLRHYSDLFVRPGGIPFGSASATTPPLPSDEQTTVPELELKVEPVLGEVPLGAPVRVNVTLTNNSDYSVCAPSDISFKSPYISGYVNDVGSTSVRSFVPLVVCHDYEPLTQLGPGESITSSLTLLRGAQGALFPTAGIAEVTVRAIWPQGGPESSIEAVAEARTTVLITGTKTKNHAEMAHTILANPEMHLVLALGGDHLKAGIETLHKALGDEILKRHYAAVEARRLAHRFMDRKPDLPAATKLVNDVDVVISPGEIKTLQKLGVSADHWE